MPTDKLIPRELILEPPLPMRAQMDDQKLLELADSIKEVGILNPVLVRPVSLDTETGTFIPYVHDDNPPVTIETRYVIIAGHRRFIASGLAHLEMLPCRVYEDNEQEDVALMVAENLCREDTTAAEEGVWIMQLVEVNGWSLDQLCQKFKRSENWINERVTLVQSDSRVVEAVAKRLITFSVAKALLKCKDDDQRFYLMQRAITYGANTREVTAWVTNWDKERPVTVDPNGQPQLIQVQVTPPPEPEPCLWCLRPDDEQQIVLVRMHHYHIRDLMDWLIRTGHHELRPDKPQDSGDSAQSAAT